MRASFTNRLSNVSGIWFWEPNAEASEIVVEGLEFAQRIRGLRTTHCFPNMFVKSHGGLKIGRTGGI